MTRALHCALLAVSGLLLIGPSPGYAQSGPPSVEVGVTYTGEAVGVPSGGVEQDVVYLDNLDATVTVRSDSLVGWPGLTAFAYGLGNQGGAPSTLVGDAQVTSNIEAPLSWRLYEAWLQQTLGTRASVLVGLYDLNAEFDVNRTGSLFLNSAHGIGTPFGLSGRNGPSIFPVTSLAVRARVRVARRGHVQAAVLDGVPGDPADPGGTVVRFGEDDGVLVASEVGVYLGGDSPARAAVVDRTIDVDAPGKLALGAWTYTTPLPTWTSINAPAASSAVRGARGCMPWPRAGSSASRAPRTRACPPSGGSAGPTTGTIGSRGTWGPGSSTPVRFQGATATGWASPSPGRSTATRSRRHGGVGESR
jgi:carbohydrate-selective porin OprB